MSDKIKNIAKNIQLLILDVDGVLTDGKINCIPDGELFKSFNIKDGMGVNLWVKKCNKHIAVITGRSKTLIQNRLNQIGIELIYDNKEQKAQAYEDIKAHFGVDDSQVAYIGDDIIDLAPLKKAALGCAPADAHFSAKDTADYICSNVGGNGAVREVVDIILEEQGLYEELINFYT